VSGARIGQSFSQVAQQFAVGQHLDRLAEPVEF
jgi:hypothetical protein